MSAKTSPARRAAFFKALRETGNQTLACERARVSRAWVQLQRSTDPAFKAEVAAAVAEARASLLAARPGGRMKPSRKWAHLDGEELVVRGSRGRRVQVARARLRQWTPRVERRFLRALETCCNLRLALKSVGLSASSLHEHRKRWPAFDVGLRGGAGDRLRQYQLGADRGGDPPARSRGGGGPGRPARDRADERRPGDQPRPGPRTAALGGGAGRRARRAGAAAPFDWLGMSGTGPGLRGAAAATRARHAGPGSGPG